MKSIFGLMFVALTLFIFIGCSDKGPTLKDAPTPPSVENQSNSEASEVSEISETSETVAKQQHPPIKKKFVGTPAPVAGSIEKAESGTIGEIFANKEKLKGKEISVRGKVMKFSPMIMGKNWVHLQDGTGEAASATNDLTVTTNDTVTVGDIVLMTGTVVINKDLGAGYTYDVIVENATFKVE